jgi:hypothetical protein
MAAASMTSNPGVEDNQRVNIANQEFLSLTAMTGTVQDFGRSSTENRYFPLSVYSITNVLTFFVSVWF